MQLLSPTVQPKSINNMGFMAAHSLVVTSKVFPTKAASTEPVGIAVEINKSVQRHCIKVSVRP